MCVSVQNHLCGCICFQTTPVVSFNFHLRKKPKVEWQLIWLNTWRLLLLIFLLFCLDRFLSYTRAAVCLYDHLLLMASALKVGQELSTVETWACVTSRPVPLQHQVGVIFVTVVRNRRCHGIITLRTCHYDRPSLRSCHWKCSCWSRQFGEICRRPYIYIYIYIVRIN